MLCDPRLLRVLARQSFCRSRKLSGGRSYMEVGLHPEFECAFFAEPLRLRLAGVGGQCSLS